MGVPMVDDTDDGEDFTEQFLADALLEADKGDRLHFCRGLPLCDGSIGEPRQCNDGTVAFGCPWCHTHTKRGDETIYEVMADAFSVTVH